MQTKVVLISGKQGSGKTTLSEILKQRLNKRPQTRAEVMKFADPLYRMHDHCLAIIKQSGIIREMKKDGKLLQLLGTEWGRSIDQDIWVKCAQGQISHIQNRLMNARQNIYVIIDDARFKNEVDGFPDALKIRLEATRDIRKERTDSWRDNEMHPSEIDLDDYVLQNKFDMIFNSGTQDKDHYANLIVNKLCQI